MKEIVRKGRRVLQIWNLRMEVYVNQDKDTNGDGERMGMKSLMFSNGSQIEEQRVYKGVSLSYLVNGGDVLSLVKGTKFNPKNIE
jgi:hypothetical protein